MGLKIVHPAAGGANGEFRAAALCVAHGLR
jgi:hypothetical protein